MAKTQARRESQRLTHIKRLTRSSDTLDELSARMTQIQSDDRDGESMSYLAAHIEFTIPDIQCDEPSSPPPDSDFDGQTFDEIFDQRESRWEAFDKISRLRDPSSPSGDSGFSFGSIDDSCDATKSPYM